MPQAENTEAPRGTTTFFDAQLLAELGAVHGATAAEDHHGEIARIVAAVHRDQLERVDHVRVGDAHDAARHLDIAHAQPCRRVRRARLRARRHIGDDIAADEIVLVDAAEREVGVGGGGIGAAAAIGGGAGDRAGRFRADMQLLELVDPGDRAAAIADLDQVDHRHHDRVAGRLAVALDPVIGLDSDVAALDQRAFRRRAADIERQHIRLADDAAELGSAPEAGSRTGLDHRDRGLLDRLERIDAAV